MTASYLRTRILRHLVMSGNRCTPNFRTIPRANVERGSSPWISKYRRAENGPQIAAEPSPGSGRIGSSNSERNQHIWGLSVSPCKIALTPMPKRPRRAFNAADTPRIVEATDRGMASGERGALSSLLRGEGLYRSQPSSWRAQCSVTRS
jgi:hypothetical protein